MQLPDWAQGSNGFIGGGGPTVLTPGQSPGTLGGIDIPPADMRDPFSGPEWARAGLDPGVNQLFGLGPQGFIPPLGLPGSWQGPTMIPTTFDPQGYPFAVPVSPGSEYAIAGSYHHTPKKMAQ